jgi:hypothetical protein
LRFVGRFARMDPGTGRSNSLPKVSFKGRHARIGSAFAMLTFIMTPLSISH